MSSTSLPESNDTLFSPSSDSELGMECADASPQLLLAHVEQHQDELASEPAVQGTKPQAELKSRTITKKRAGTSSRSDTAPAAPAAPVSVFVKKPRKHNKIEILKLRHVVAELQTQVSNLQVAQKQKPRTVAAHFAAQKQLRTSSKTADASAATPRSMWLELAVEQYRSRQESETLNRELRSAVAHQQHVANSLQELAHTQGFHKVRLPMSLIAEVNCCLHVFVVWCTL